MILQVHRVNCNIPNPEERPIRGIFQTVTLITSFELAIICSQSTNKTCSGKQIWKLNRGPSRRTVTYKGPLLRFHIEIDIDLDIDIDIYIYIHTYMCMYNCLFCPGGRQFKTSHPGRLWHAEPWLRARLSESASVVANIQSPGRIQKMDPPWSSIIYTIGVFVQDLGVLFFSGSCLGSA